jgi:hypothetical protein
MGTSALGYIARRAQNLEPGRVTVLLEPVIDVAAAPMHIQPVPMPAAINVVNGQPLK